VQYGPNLQAQAEYLHQRQLLPTACTCEELAAICGWHISEATLQQWRLLHLSAVPAIERDEWVARHFEILLTGYAAQPPPPAS
jgi:hypothetical protein